MFKCANITFVNHIWNYASHNAEARAHSISEELKKKFYGLNLCFPTAAKSLVRNETYTSTVNKRKTGCNKLTALSSVLAGPAQNKGMRLLLTKEEKRGDGKRKENMYNFSENKRKDTPKTKFRGFIKNMAVIGANSAEFFFYVFLQLFSVVFFSWKCWFFYIGLFQEKDVVVWIGP